MIHPTAVIDKKAEVADDVDIGPYCVIGPEARIGSGTRLVSHVSITGRTDIGTHCTIHPFASLGGDPQDITYKGEDTTCVIGDHNHIGEYVTINKASAKADRVTRVGSRNIIMAYSHIGHDCVVGNEVQMANAATLGGHVHVADFAIVSGLVAVHEFLPGRKIRHGERPHRGPAGYSPFRHGRAHRRKQGHAPRSQHRGP